MCLQSGEGQGDMKEGEIQLFGGRHKRGVRDEIWQKKIRDF